MKEATPSRCGFFVNVTLVVWIGRALPPLNKNALSPGGLMLAAMSL